MMIGFIGAGVMARALGKGLIDGGIVSTRELICSAPTEQDGRPFLDAFSGSRWTSDNPEVVRSSDLIILAVKPQVFPEALGAIKPVSAGKLFLSIAAGMTLEKIRGWLDPTAHLVRAMPNTPMQIGLGASVYAGDALVTASDYELVHRVLASAGKAWRVEENQPTFSISSMRWRAAARRWAFRASWRRPWRSRPRSARRSSRRNRISLHSNSPRR
jgi:pyrroline-5-carboxylate reductase